MWRFLRDDVEPAILSMPGCVGLSVLADRRSGLCIVSTAWETRQAMHGSVVPLRDLTSKILHGSAGRRRERAAAGAFRRNGKPE